MRLAVVLFVLLAGAAAVGAVAAPAPTYTVAFQGSGSEHQLDNKQNVEDDGSCEAAEHVDVTAAVSWSASWTRFRATTRSTLGAPAKIDGSRVTGSHVKDACGLPLDEAPPEWVSQASCDDALVTSAGPQLSAATRGKSLMLAVAAPSFVLPVSVKCPLNVRNDQLTAHAAVALKKLSALKRGQSISIRIGTSAPGPGDLYAPAFDCSAPTKPYEGYRTVDHCQDDLSWSGTLKITRAS